MVIVLSKETEGGGGLAMCSLSRSNHAVPLQYIFFHYEDWTQRHDTFSQIQDLLCNWTFLWHACHSGYL